ncbi:MAG: histidinol-phosphate aminotransferase family protein [Gammaproteobacteria bacterium]|nr:histidinol-phosphate aminotransferase family protein [Gammaproteobacteria bacterium]
MPARYTMSQTTFQSSRRNFIRACGSGAAMLGSGLISAPGLARGANQLDLRVNAAPLWLNYNENSLGMSPRATLAAQQATAESGNRYPDDAVATLRETIGNKLDVDPEQVIFGNGSTEVIQAIVTYAEGQSAKLIEPAPTFGDARRYCRAEGLEVIQVPVDQNFETDLVGLQKRAAATRGALLINICNPNNPTGSIVNHRALESWINAAPADHIFLIDEAYFDYAQQNPDYRSVLSLIKEGRENLVLTRTFSKIHGMAGMRIGFGVAAPKTAREVRKFAAGFNLSTAGTAAALAALADREFYQQSLASNQLAKTTLLTTLDELGLEHIASNTNFVLHRINARLQDYSARMAENGIHVGRRMTTEDGWNRVSLGTPQEMQAFTETLKVFRQRGWV